MGLLDGVTKEQVLHAIDAGMRDVSLFMPEPERSIFTGLAALGDVIEAAMRAKAAGASNDALVASISSTNLAAADAEMRAELPGG